MPLTLNIIREDLSFLYSISMDWDQDWEEQFERFEDVKGQQVDFTFAKAYWLPDWATVMIFRSYLESINASFQILMDNAENLDPYLVICNEEF